MSHIRRTAARGLKKGDRFSISRTFSRDDTELFGRITRDFNPVHYHEAWARGKGIPDPICHGLLVGSMLCEIGGQIGWLASSMNFRFLQPVYFGDTITCTFTITDIDSRQRASARVEFHNQAGQKVLSAELGGILPSQSERRLLDQMMAAGDPHNPLFSLEE